MLSHRGAVSASIRAVRMEQADCSHLEAEVFDARFAIIDDALALQRTRAMLLPLRRSLSSYVTSLRQQDRRGALTRAWVTLSSPPGRQYAHACRVLRLWKSRGFRLGAAPFSRSALRAAIGVRLRAASYTLKVAGSMASSLRYIAYGAMLRDVVPAPHGTILPWSDAI